MTRRIFYNGYIYTGNRNNTLVEAMYIKDDKIEFLGTNKEVKKYEDCADGIIDLNKRTVVPGFIDSHLHLLAYGKSLSEVNLSSCKSVDEVINVSKKFIKDNNINSGKWLIGFGWNHENFESKSMLTKYDLDKISTEVPIVLKRACLHITSCNSKALEVANITSDTKIEGGKIDVAKGDTIGILRENAANLIEKYIPKFTKKDKKELVVKALEKLSSYGITGVHTDDLGKDNGGLEMLDIYKELETEDRLSVRIYIQSRITNYEETKKYFEDGYCKYNGSDNFKLGSIKLLGDGSLGGKTAAMNEPYENSDETGIALFTQDELDKIVDLSHVNDVAVVIHAIGDRTIDMAINSFEKAKATHPEHDNVRHGIVHCQITSKTALERIKKNNILAYIQPIFIAADSKVIEKSVGKERTKYSYNWKTLNDNGVVTFGTDSPVESPNPFDNIYCAVTRKDLEGKPEIGFLKEQSLTVEESIRAYTVNSAYASYEEDVKGTLEVGKLADFVVLSDNIFEIDKDKIKDISCIMTVKGGRIVWDK